MNFIYVSVLLLIVRRTSSAVSYNWTYTYDPSSTAWNPLKGFVPYYYWTGPQPTINFPHSMENQYFSMKSLMRGPNLFDFSSIDSVLNNTAKRNHHAIVRVYADYPGKSLNSSIPDFSVEWTNNIFGIF
ncbi:unnamed protein product [Adineta ricciae]|uniref:Uncharacterized protein n=1 Tax=Adineta ricciae TaxID=249248 RepID=A0A815SMU6_ADIRI|nr:unnamed protein product [Adineta ricciae]